MNAAEELLLAQIRQAGLPEPERQFAYAKGRRLKADFAWPLLHLLVEVTGGIWQRKAHGSVSGVLADIDRLNAATRHGYATLRFTPQMVESGEALSVLREVLTGPLNVENGGNAP